MLLQIALFHSFFMAEWYSIVYMYHIFFIHSSVDGHLGCFHVLTILGILTFYWGDNTKPPAPPFLLIVFFLFVF